MAHNILEPRGPLPRSVYWLRRGSLVLLVIFVVVLIAVLANHGGGKKKPTASVTTSTSSSPPPTTSSAPVTTASTPASTPATTASTTAAAGTCATSALSLSLATSAKTYGPSGAAVHFTATLSDSGGACSAAGPLTVVVTTGGVRVWGSADCTPANTDAMTAIAANGHADATRSWDRTRSTAGCGTVTGDKDAQPGYYSAVATWAGHTSSAVSFRLE